MAALQSMAIVYCRVPAALSRFSPGSARSRDVSDSRKRSAQFQFQPMATGGSDAKMFARVSLGNCCGLEIRHTFENRDIRLLGVA